MGYSIYTIFETEKQRDIVLEFLKCHESFWKGVYDFKYLGGPYTDAAYVADTDKDKPKIVFEFITSGNPEAQIAYAILQWIMKKFNIPGSYDGQEPLEGFLENQFNIYQRLSLNVDIRKFYDHIQTIVRYLNEKWAIANSSREDT